MTQVGWLGLGAMGAPMAVQLARGGHDVVGYDVDQGRLSELVSDGILPAASAIEAARGREVIAVMVATPAQAMDVLFGPEGAAAALGAGSIVLLLATIGPEAATEIAARLALRNIKVVDAPVSGGVARAAGGQLLFMVSGDEADVTAVRPLIDLMSSQVSIVGSAIGDGQRVKLVNQLLCGIHIAAAAEALAFAEAIGLDPRQCWETIRHGAAASFMLEDRGARMLDSGPAPVRSAVKIFMKDMGMVAHAAHQESFPVPLASAARELYDLAGRSGRGDQDDSVLIEMFRERLLDE